MAIDSKAKRFQVLTFGGPFTEILPDPDGTIAATDRAHLLLLYGGNPLEGPTVVLDQIIDWPGPGFALQLVRGGIG